MALTKKTAIDKIEIVGVFKHIQVREKISILENGSEISSSFNRYALAPGSDITKQPQEIKDIANLIWTKEIKAAWQNHPKD